jgi:LysR family transcriptional regulator, hydrogen peroxide-inducible genes activator
MQFCHLGGFSPKVSFQSAQIETMLSFVAAGWGISLVLAMAKGPQEAETLEFRNMAGLRRKIGTIYRVAQPLSLAARALLGFFQLEGKAMGMLDKA